MKLADMRTFTLFLTLLITSAATLAGGGNKAVDWLMKMSQATRKLSYDGTFVYQHDEQLEAMRIIHLVDRDSVQERLVSLNGAAREVIRDDQKVMCYLPDRKSVVVEHRLARQKSFPAILPDRVEDLEEHYIIKLTGPDRVTNRPAQIVLIKPRDGYRYGYRLWADRRTGLLLKADLRDHKGKALEQFMFTQVDIERPIEPTDLQPGMVIEELAWYWGKMMGILEAQAVTGWSVGQLPDGFVLANRIMRKNPTRDRPVEHLVYSDGLAAVSVFIEKMDTENRARMVGTTRMGAVHAYGSVINDHQIIVVGEVPAATVELIGKSVVAAQ